MGRWRMRGVTQAMTGPFGDAAMSGRVASDLEVIESVLRRAEGVRHVAVVLRHGTPTAYVMPATADVAALRAHVEAALPGSEPEIEPVDELPLTANGQVDRAALSAPDYVASTARRYMAPRTEAERVLAQVWADVLGVEGVGVEDNFFDLAGDSIDVIHLVAKAKEAGLDIATEDVFRLKTVAAIAAVSGTADPSAGTLDAHADTPLISLSQQEIDAIEAKWG